MFRRHMISAAVLALSAGMAVPAIAQDMPAQDMPAAEAQTVDGFNRDMHFNGAYVSAFGGLAMPRSIVGDTITFDRNGDGTYGDTVSTSTGANAFSPGFCNGAYQSTANSACENDRSRGEYGVRIGYDSRMSDFVIGGLIEVNKSDATDFTSGFSTTPAAYGVARKLDYGISARARAGYTPGGGALFYVTGGGTYAKLNHTFTTTNTANSFTELNDGKMVWGWQAGGGAEIMVTDRVSLGLEYLKTRYTDNKYYVNVAQGSAPATNPFVLGGTTTNLRPAETQFGYNTFRATLGFRF